MIKSSAATSFTKYLDEIEALVKGGKLDQAWRLCNEGVVRLKDKFERTMMYYQMSKIRKKEGNCKAALALMGAVVAGLGGPGGTTHVKYINGLLSKVGKDEKDFEKFITLCRGNPKQAIRSVEDWLHT